MEFTDLYKQSNSSLAKFSPDGKYIAVAVEHRLIVRDSENPKRIHRVFSCEYETAPYIQEIEWSMDSEYILTASYAMNRVDAWSIEDESWRCTITDEVARVERAQWTKDSRHILTFSELDLRVSVWSLLDADDRRYIQFPKSKAGVSFSPDGAYMALAQRHDYHDYIGIYNTESWQLVKEIAVETLDMSGISWSPDGLHIAAWDMAASLLVVVVNVAGVVKRVYQPEEEVLGVRMCAWAPAGQLLALGGYDRKVRVLNHLTWRPIATLTHRAIVNGDVDVFIEVEVGQTLAQASKAVMSSTQRQHTRFDLAPTPANIQVVQHQDVHRADAKNGVSFVEFSADGSLLATVSEGMPNAVWVWRASDMRLATVIQTMKPIRVCRWSPVEAVLAFTTGSATVYLWKQDHGCHLYEIPSATIAASSLAWNPNGGSMAILSKGLFSLAFITE
ncbi:hypothetical protein GGI25_000150 [Coemansia spiralis]|uniref:Uncharacterized protein n=2 Tax=Coemansia TaxID=4863 RepID=A0A9W8GCW7_9FUNG|nr:Quino protein amine dehydrogenase [Coemansia spiralis]KAJ1992478.1 hypothetical protein EDC05_002795 [Coemansia umbellata]KAJ2621808.1 hypothetical protein GGI26_003788 [Coemansia sp. RSA 1358]KAJ2681195.1 hypothetical protein GGI25_000150 [Coemansia spiralis]